MLNADNRLISGHPLLQFETCCLVYVEEGVCSKDFVEVYAATASKLRAISTAAQIPFLNYSGREGARNRLESELSLSGRQSLLLCGGLLESEITRLALSALMGGFDVFVLSNWCLSYEPEHKALFEARICHKGGIVLTGFQAIRELSAQCKDEKIASSLLKLIGEFS